ncbi:MAG: zinc-ribbon domain-containing protein [Proteobacteria bacterium]|nr:zinc-ribbon domain-containing protein [Pseudomonadota bacterium]
MKKSESPSLLQGLFTSCPHCMQQFRIQAAQLSMASGQVECGSCGHQFNALSRLSDAPLVLDELNYEFDYEPMHESAHETGPIPAPDQEPEFEIPASSNDEGSDSEVEQQEIEATPSGKEVEVDEEALLRELPELFSESLPEDLPDDFPDELRETLPAKRSLFATISWGLGAFLLLIIIVVQLAWFNRDQLLMRYPQLDPVAREICERLHCEILRHKDISSIRMLNRDVRNHPLYEGSLLVNATMANQSETIQPFPIIQLALFNLGGEVIGFREFKPEQYLDDSINIQAGMMPQSPIHFVLEVNGPTKDAVSFEFHFL